MYGGPGSEDDIRRNLQNVIDELKAQKNINKDLKSKLAQSMVERARAIEALHDSIADRRNTDNLLLALKIAELVVYDAAQGAYDRTEAQEALAVVRSAIGVFKQESPLAKYGRSVTIEVDSWKGIRSESNAMNVYKWEGNK